MDAVPLPSEWMDACRAELVAAAAQWVSDTGTALERAQNRADSVGEANRLFHVQRALDRWQHSAPERIVSLLLSSMKERCSEPRLGATSPLLPSEMELVDDDVVSESIGISRLVTGIFSVAEWEIRTVERALVGHIKDFSERSNPFHPEAIARTIWKLAEDLGLQREERAACLRVSLDATTALARTAYACLGTWLAGQREVGPLAIQRQSEVHNAIPVDVLAGLAAEAPPLALELEPMHGRPFDAAPTPRGGSPKAGGEVVFTRLMRGVEDILGDVRLTHELRRVLSGLQLGVLRFAFGTPSSLYSTQHEMWDITGVLVQYALQHCLKDRVVHDDFVLFADQAIQTLLRLDPSRLHELDKTLVRLRRYVKERPAELVESRRHASMQFARLEERRRQIRSVSINRHRERINAVIADQEIPYRLRQFLLVDWAEALAHAEVAEGPKSPAYAELWGAVDRMMRAVQKNTLTADAASLQEKMELLKLLERGITCVAVPSVEKYELTDILDRTGMISREGEEWSDSDIGGLDSALPPSPSPAPHRRDFWGAQSQSGGKGWSTADETTVGFTTAMPTSDAEHCVNALQEDDLIELFLAGTWVEVRLVELAEDGQIFLFEGETDGGGTHQLTRRALLRLFREGLATPI
ncbi:uncharacterized protein DUF1631 [Roseateles depolymerans]|uniref:Uncharacterized protein n=1 Tax=Roseateles depolymerans TaxID=76731 RepID=A0A0U3MZ88_9BURK|nr:DUF1631 family protein [Roseateles depolymerans]ALV05259.1 hypothetical protein RD2015_763 [Roseateles depolymerans]REG14725.1 uncharacterized protein DUF1631 [Roseateles depolymerans]